MNRRNFLSLISAGIAGIALDQAIPLGRVWSFPKKIVFPPRGNVFLKTHWITVETLAMLKKHLAAQGVSEEQFLRSWNVGSQVRIHLPQKLLVIEDARRDNFHTPS